MTTRQMPLFANLAAPGQSGPRWTTSELERRAQVDAGQCVVANVRTGKKDPGDLALVAWAEATGRFVYIGWNVHHTRWTKKSDDWEPVAQSQAGTNQRNIWCA